VRRLLAILLLTIFSLPYASVFFASAPVEASLPACCRKNGTHHCVMMRSVGTQQNERVSMIFEKCPYTPGVATAVNLKTHAAPTRAIIFAELVSHPAIHAQTQAKYRIFSDRSRQKRGPPTLLA
jgi:hypothetical protein